MIGALFGSEESFAETRSVYVRFRFSAGDQRPKITLRVCATRYGPKEPWPEPRVDVSDLLLLVTTPAESEEVRELVAQLHVKYRERWG